MRLRIFIAGTWSTWDFISLLSEMESLALFVEEGSVKDFLQLEMDIEPGDGKVTFHGYKSPTTRFTVSRVSYNSPGSMDLLGIAKVVEQVRLLLQYVIDLIIHRNDRELSRQEKKLHIHQLRLNLMKKIEDEQPGLLPLVKDGRLDNFFNLVDDGKVLSVDIVDE